MKLKYIFILSIVMSSLNVQAHTLTADNDTLPYTYKRFMAQPDLKCVEGKANAQGQSLNLYRIGSHYYLEVPRKVLNRDILVTMQTVRTYSGYVSPYSGVVRFLPGKDKHTLFLRRNTSVDVQTDSTSASMMNAIRESGMQPIDMAFTVASMGNKGKSYLIDITTDINTAKGLFDVSGNISLSHPDATRSQVIDMKGIEGGVLVDLMRSQTDTQNNTMDTQIEIATTNDLEFILQVLPKRREKLKLNNPFYGFDTFSRQEYDTKNYVSRKRDYISRWNFLSGDPIIVYISPIIPKPYQTTIRKAFDEWIPAFQASGIKKPFIFSSDTKDAMLTYHHIYVDWGGANLPHSTCVTDPLTGEIMSARMDVNERGVEDYIRRYYTLCRHIDHRVAKDMEDLGTTQDIVRSMAAHEIGHVLGLKSNNAGNNGFTIAQLRSPQWAAQNGPSASVTDNLIFNYVAQDGDGLKASDILPKVSVYDREAIAYAYGKRMAPPSLENTYYASINPFKDIYAPQRTLSNNWIEAARLGIRNISKGYVSLDQDMGKLASDQNNDHEEYELILNALSEYQQMVENVASLVGYDQIVPIIRGINEHHNHYTSRQTQIDALHFLNQEILHGVPVWSNQPRLNEICSGNISDMMRAIAVSVYKRLLRKEVIHNLVAAETEMGNKTYSAKELFQFVDHELFHDFNAEQPLPEYERLLISNVVPDLADKVFQSDLSLGMDDEGAIVLHNYFMHIAEKVKYLAKNHKDKVTREAYGMVMMRLNRQYFDKQH